MAKNIEITEEQLTSLIQTAAQAGARAALDAHSLGAPQVPAAPQGPDAQWAAEMAQRRGLDKPVIESKTFECKSAETGATFTARVVRDVVVELLDYKYPEGIDRHETDDPPGLVPHGKEIKDANNKETPDYKQWRWTEFWQADLRKYIGRKLPAHVRVDAKVIIEAAE